MAFFLCMQTSKVLLAIKKDLNSRDVNWTKDANHVAPDTEKVCKNQKQKEGVHTPRLLLQTTELGLKLCELSHK